MDIIHMLLELLLPVLERLGFKRVRQYTALGCLAVGLVMTAVLTVDNFRCFLPHPGAHWHYHPTHPLTCVTNLPLVTAGSPFML
jgi:hypothetical protein